MGEKTSSRMIKTVDHPWMKIIIALMSTGAFAGMGTGLWSYLQTRETTKLEARKLELEAARNNKDVELQIAAVMEIIAEQGRQLKQFKEALEKLSKGQRAGARQIVKEVEIPLTQGMPILRGRALQSYEAVEAEQKQITEQLEDVKDRLDKKK
jgi:hypothetical protein